MNRSKKGKNRKLFKKKSHSNNRLGCIIAIIVLIPIFFGVYLYCQQINIQKNNEPQTDTSFQIPPGKDLETPISLVPRQEQIIRHSGYTVSYNKDLKIPNWVSYELTREETKGKEKRGNRFRLFFNNRSTYNNNGTICYSPIPDFFFQIFPSSSI